MKLLAVIWTSPNTLLGLLIGGLGLIGGSRCQWVAGCVEFHGGLVRWLLKRGPLDQGILAITLGHCILGQSPTALQIARKHEHVHVRQYERWGPFFLPAYLGCSFFLWIGQHDAYRDNPFEVEAYSIADIESRSLPRE